MDWLCLEITPEVSFGMFYKPYPGDDVLRKFISLTRQHISASREAETGSYPKSVQQIEEGIDRLVG